MGLVCAAVGFPPTFDGMPPASVQIIACRRRPLAVWPPSREYVDPNLCVPDGHAPLHAEIDWYQTEAISRRKELWSMHAVIGWQ